MTLSLHGCVLVIDSKSAHATKAFHNSLIRGSEVTMVGKTCAAETAQKTEPQQLLSTNEVC